MLLIGGAVALVTMRTTRSWCRGPSVALSTCSGRSCCAVPRRSSSPAPSSRTRLGRSIFIDASTRRRLPRRHRHHARRDPGTAAAHPRRSRAADPDAGVWELEAWSSGPTAARARDRGGRRARDPAGARPHGRCRRIARPRDAAARRAARAVAGRARRRPRRVDGTAPQGRPATGGVAFAAFALAVALASFRRTASLGLVSVMALTFVYYATWSVRTCWAPRAPSRPTWPGGRRSGSTPVAGGVLLVSSWRR
jgi:hypothetical protein